MKIKKINEKPCAFITNPKDRGRKSIKKDSKVYLEDGQNFEIELFNPLQESVLAEIKVNRKSVSPSGLILRPGERFYLDCFVDDKKKFVFKTYEVENTEESKEAISKNGLVEVFFYKEETLQLNNWRERFIPVIERRYPVCYPWYPNPWNWYTNTTGGLPTCTTTTTALGSLQNSNNQNLNNVISGTYIVDGLNSLSGLNTSILNTSILNTPNSRSAYYSCNTPNTPNTQVNLSSAFIETGRIEKGEISIQQFDEIDMQFEKCYISNVVYQLLPESQRPIETKELISDRKFCEECGDKLKGTEKFCSQCGSKI
jgi:hypothetical protein